MALALGAGIAAFGLASRAVDAPAKFVEGEGVLVALPVLEPFGLPVDAIPDLDGDGIDDFVVGTLILNPSTGGVAVHSGATGANPAGSPKRCPIVRMTFSG